MPRKIYLIAAEIRKDWKKLNYAVRPYLDVMNQLESVDQKYGWDSAASVIRYFLGNATTWRGEAAHRVKKELNEMIEGVY